MPRGIARGSKRIVHGAERAQAHGFMYPFFVLSATTIAIPFTVMHFAFGQPRLLHGLIGRVHEHPKPSHGILVHSGSNGLPLAGCHVAVAIPLVGGH